MSKSIRYAVFIFLLMFSGIIVHSQNEGKNDPTVSNGSVSQGEIRKIFEEWEPKVVKSNLQQPEDFGKGQSQRSLVDSRGTDFWLLFKKNNDGQSVQMFLDISGTENANGTVTIPGIGFSVNFTVTANAVTRVNIPSNAILNPSGIIENLGIHVIADKEVTVYGMNQRGASTDGFLGLPLDILGNQYLVVTYPILNWGGFYPDESYAPQFAIVSPYDNNVVTITPKDQTFNGNPAGVPFSITLNQGQTYLVRGRMSNSYTADLTGSIISSTLPVAVFSGSSCASIPQSVPACDHLVEQIPPLSTWGQTFVTRPLETRINGDLWRFLSSQNNTQLYIDGVLAATLNFGDFYETILTTSSFIEASNPVLAIQFSMSSDWDGVIADPFMMVIPPYQQYLDSYSFSTPASGFVGNYFTSAVDNDGVSDMILNGVPLNSAGFFAIGTTGFSAGAFPVSINTSYSISNSGGYPSGLYVYGFGSYDSYGFPGGLSLLSINPGSGPSIELTNTVIGELFCISVSSSVDIEISALITDSDEPLVQSAILFYRNIGETDFSFIPMTQGVADEWSATIFATTTQFPGLEFYIFATDGQIAATSPSVDPENNPYVIGIDNMPPQIVHVPVTNSPTGNQILVSAEVTDNTASVALVQLFYRISGGTPFYSSLAMNGTGGDTFESIISGSQMTDQGIEYFIKASDNFGVSCFFGLPDIPFFIAPGSAENIPPIASGFPGITPSVFIGDTYSLSVQFQSPEVGQITDVVVNDGGLPGFSATITPGNTAIVEFDLIGQNDNLGTHLIEFIATDNGDPVMSTTVIFQISVIDPLEGHVICIPEGWSGISTYNDPVNPDMVDIFASLVADDKVVIVLGDNGFYWPSQNINTFTEGWDVKKGYKIKMSEPACLGIPGEMPGDKSFTAKKGASFIPVLCDQSVPATDIFNQFGNDMLFAFDIYNQLIYWPQGGIFTLETIEPGVGYLVNMLQQSEAVYDCNQGQKNNIVKPQPPIYENAPWKIQRSGSVHLISINNSAFGELQTGDFVGVFNSGGICTGFIQYNGESTNILMVAYGNEYENSQNGFSAGESMTFRIYKQALKQEILVTAVFDTSMPDAGLFKDLGQSKIVSFTASAASINEGMLNEISLYPNPNNGIVHLDMPEISEKVIVEIMNTAGQTMHAETIESSAGRNHQIDLRMVGQGVYFVKLSNNSEIVVKKVVIH
ncbi:MAG: T9SS type A sorting domain-containing protein [Sphingobacteriia bacterium]|nr:T9SS type A sorting domain-containing protein [Sphingobacteriia bacterium]